MGRRCLLVIFVSGKRRLPVPPASTTPFIIYLGTGRTSATPIIQRGIVLQSRRYADLSMESGGKRAAQPELFAPGDSWRYDYGGSGLFAQGMFRTRA